MKHRHHVKPKHSGGEDLEENLTPPIPVVRHAMFHWCEWRRTGNEFDRIAWRSLSGLIGREEARILACIEWNKRALEEGTHPFLLANRSWNQSEVSKKSAHTQLERGTLNLLKFHSCPEYSARISERNKQLVKEGKHHFLRGNETWDRIAVAKENARKQIENGTLPLLAQNRTWDYGVIAKEARASMSEESVEHMIRKQTVNRRINAGWTLEKLLFIREQLPSSSNKILKKCQDKYSWPSSRGVIQNILRVLESEEISSILKIDVNY